MRITVDLADGIIISAAKHTTLDELEQFANEEKPGIKWQVSASPHAVSIDPMDNENFKWLLIPKKGGGKMKSAAILEVGKNIHDQFFNDQLETECQEVQTVWGEA